MADYKYKKLAQFEHFEKNMTQEGVENIFKNGDSINYQIPANDFFRVLKPNCKGNTVLHLAQEKYQIDAFEILIKHGADFTIKNDNDETVILKSVKKIFYNIKEYYVYSFINHSLAGHVDFGITTNPTNEYGVSHFHAACVVNHIKAVEFFLTNGVSVNDAVSANSPYFPGYSALHFAVTYRNFQVVELLLKTGADINITDTKGLSSLHLIIQRNMEIVLHKRKDSATFFSNLNEKLELFDRLISYVSLDDGVDQWNLIDSIGLSRFHVAAMLQSSSVVEKAIEEGADLQLAINSDSPFLPGYTALHFAAHFNHDTFIKLMRRGGNINARDSEGVTPFDLFLQRCDGNLFYDLILHRSEWRKITFLDERTKLLHFVGNARRDKTLKKFLRNNSNQLNSFIPFNSPICPGYTFLHLVVAFIGITDFRDADDNDYDVDLTVEGPGEEDLRHIEIIKYCVEMGADITIQDIHGSTPLHLAFRNCRPIAVNELLKCCSHGKIVNPIDKDGLSHLHIACAAPRDRDDEGDELEEASEKMAKSLLGQGANPNHSLVSSVKWKNQDDRKVFLNVGWTPLHVAVATSNVRLIKILLEHGADIYAKDINGLTPIHLILSSTCDYKDVGNALLSTENLKDSIADCGLSHLHVACYVKNVSAVRKLLNNGADTETIISYKKSTICNHNERAKNGRNFRYCNVCNPFLEPLFFVARFAGCTPLFAALRTYGEAEVIELLVQHHAKVLARNPGASFPFYRTDDRDAYWWNSHVIPKLGSNEILRKCIQEHTGITMLHAYSAVLDVKAVVDLLNSGANVNAKVHMDSPLWPGCTPLHLLSLNRDLHEWKRPTLHKFETIAKLLLKKEADVLWRNAQQNTPVHEAFRRFVRQPNFAFSNDNHVFDRRKASYVTMLLKNQTDFSVNPTDATGLSHFHIACSCGDVATVEEFIKHDVDINGSVDYFSRIDGGFTPLHFAVIAQSKEVVDILLKNGADPDSKTCLDKTSLHLAVQFNLTNEHLFKSLIRAGADMSAKNVYGETPPDSLFREYSYSNAAEIFLKHGVRVNVFDEKTDEGYIPSVLDSLRNNRICQEPVFRAVILHPRLNDDDEMDRSPIHNIVSTDKRLTSTSDYSKAIEKYIQVGFDIDRRDKKGRTALHIATQFKNFVGIHALLDNGADINITDENRNTPYSYCLQFDERNKNYEFEVFKVLKMHIDKLQLFKLYVNDTNKICDRTISDQFPQIPQKSYEKEVSELSNTKIDISHPFTLLDFLSETNAVSAYPRMPRVVRDAIDACFQTCGDYLQEHFPNLVCLLRLQHRKAKSRMSMIDPAKVSLDFISSTEIPDLCSDIIIKFLANVDLSNLIQSAEVEWQPNKRMRLV